MPFRPATFSSSSSGGTLQSYYWPTTPQAILYGNGSDINVGKSISISSNGNYVLAGASHCAYVFVRGAGSPLWTIQQRIPTSLVDQGFASSVSISPDATYAVIGVPGKQIGIDLVPMGAVMFYTRSGSTWTFTEEERASDKEANDEFGCSVSMSNNGLYTIVGARYEDDGGLNAGAAYVFTGGGSTWTQQQKILANDAQAGDQFGSSVSMALNGATILIGAPYEDDGGSNAGAAYVFTLSGNTWTQQQKILASDAAANDEFGKSVTLSNDGFFAVIHNTNGSAYIYKRNSGENTFYQIFQIIGSFLGSTISDDGTVILSGGSSSKVYLTRDNIPIDEIELSGFWIPSISYDGTTTAIGNPTYSKIYIYVK